MSSLIVICNPPKNSFGSEYSVWGEMVMSSHCCSSLSLNLNFATLEKFLQIISQNKEQSVSQNPFCSMSHAASICAATNWWA